MGNLTIGYNALRNYFVDPDIRTGSHNLIVGDANNYSSYGRVVLGFYNNSLNSYATVTGGNVNTASGYGSSVSGGGYFNAGGGITQSNNYGWSAGGIGAGTYHNP